MKTKISAIELLGYFPKLNKRKLKEMRDNGLSCDYLGGRYWYNYDDVVRWLM